MRIKHYFFALAAASTLFIASCKKDKNEPELTQQEKLVSAHTWKVSALTVAKSDDPTKDSSILKDCSEKAMFNFGSNKAFTITDPSRTCDSTIINYDNGKWELSASGATLTLKGNKTFAWTVKTLNDSQLKATYLDSISPDKKVTKTITLSK